MISKDMACVYVLFKRANPQEPIMALTQKDDACMMVDLLGRHHFSYKKLPVVRFDHVQEDDISEPDDYIQSFNELFCGGDDYYDAD